MSSQSVISVRGAREHNLKNINVDIPREKFVVITGLSGSGKSSLAFDTVYAEGQRRYVESLSAYARQFLQLMKKPDVDAIEGLSPSISIEQKTTSKNPRSTVGTVTEIYDYFRLLFARIGVPHSPKTGLPIQAQTPSQIANSIQSLSPGTKILLIAHVVKKKRGEHKKEIEALKNKGYQRFYINETLYDAGALPKLQKTKINSISVVVDRLVIQEDEDGSLRTRLVDSIETALKEGDGVLCVEDMTRNTQTTYSENFACPESGFTLKEKEPRLFSFNSPQGACKACDGLGQTKRFHEKAIVNENLSLREGAILPWTSRGLVQFMEDPDYFTQILDAVTRHYEVSVATPFKDLSKMIQERILYGSGHTKISFSIKSGGKTTTFQKPFPGVIAYLEKLLHDSRKTWTGEFLKEFQVEMACPACEGKRLNEEALCVKVGGKDISALTQLSIAEALLWFENLQLTSQETSIAERILKEIKDRLSFLVNVGLDYLTLSRASGTLSGGESQRIRLASQIGAGLTGVLYVLDEPSIGLHQRDNDRLLLSLKRLRDLGNSVVVVEHDEDAIRQADYVIDMGPRAGNLGGNVIACGTAKEIEKIEESITGAYLSGKRSIPVPQKRRSSRRHVCLINARGNNLKGVSIEVPLGTFTCVTGVSGGGKSTLIIETLYKALNEALNGGRDVPAPFDKITGVEYVDKIIDIDQSPIGRTPRSNPATYVGCFTPIREWFANLPDAKARGYAPGRFSFNVKGGRCEACQGDGVKKIEMHFLPDVYVACDECGGKRYNKETLDITYKGKNIADVLDMTVDEACEFFAHHTHVETKLKTLQEVGLGYIHVGQQAVTLSGGEAQRVKLAKELSKRATGRTIYILDEPTTGLHFEDIKKLLEVLHTLVNQGNTVVVIEHNLDVIKTADFIIDIGPEGGEGGGRIIATGTPEKVAKYKESYTGQYLAPMLK